MDAKVGLSSCNVVASAIRPAARTSTKLTRVQMAKLVGYQPRCVSRLEKRGDLLPSTLRKSVEAMGGNLSLVAEFPDREPVVFSGIAEVEP